MRRFALLLLLIGIPHGALRAQTALALNLTLPTLGGDQLWSDQLVYGQWRMQKNELTGDYRLLDPADMRRASGEEADCRAAFNSLKRDGIIRPLKGKAVVTLHGLGRARSCMNVIGGHL